MILFKKDGVGVEPLMPGKYTHNGIDILNMDEAVEFTGLDRERLSRRWTEMFGHLLPEADELGMTSKPPDSPLWENMTAEQKDELVNEALYPQLPPRMFQAFKAIVEKRGFSIHCKHFYPEVENGRLVLVAMLGMLIQNAMLTSEYDGMDDTEFAGQDGVWTKTWNEIEPPKWARVAVYRKGISRPQWGKVAWAEYAPYVDDGNGGQMLDPFWGQYPTKQLEKCAKAAGLRELFPENSGWYCREEMQKSRAELRNRMVKGKPHEHPGLHMADDVLPEDGDALPSEDMIDEDGFRDLLERVHPDPALAEAFMSDMRGKHSRLWRRNKPSFHQRVAEELRAMLERRRA